MSSWIVFRILSIGNIWNCCENMRRAKEDTYFDIAKAMSFRSTCLHAQVGAVLVKNNCVISTGYNGSAIGEINCCDSGICKKEHELFEIGAPNSYEYCESVHAEMNAIINAAKNNGGTDGSNMYVYYHRIDGKKIDAHICKMCQKAIKNAGIIEIRTFEKQ